MIRESSAAYRSAGVQLRRAIGSLLLVAVVLTAVGWAPGPTVAARPPAALKGISEQRTSSVARPLVFAANVGQFASPARFQVQGAYATLFLADDAIWLTLLDQQPSTAARQQPKISTSQPIPPNELLSPVHPLALHGAHLKLSFVGANAHPTIEPFDRLATHISYFQGNQAQWHPDVPVWGGVRYRNLYPGIDLELSGAHGQLEQRLKVQAGADLRAVRLRVEGADAQRVDSHYLRLQTAAGEVTVPLLQVETPDGQPLFLGEAEAAVEGTDISAPFARSLHASSSIAPQDATDVKYSTFIGGMFDDTAWGIAIDGDGSAYIAGRTFSPNFPTTPGAFDILCGTDSPGQCNKSGNTYYFDIVVTKLNETGTAPSYSTFIGGTSGEGAYGIALDDSGNAYVSGYTFSSDFPTTSNAFDQECGSDNTCNDTRDGFVLKLNSDGTDLDYATYLGGENADSGTAIAIDASGVAYVTGWTYSPDFPTQNALDDSCGRDGLCTYDPQTNTVRADAFVAKLDADGASLTYSTFLGGRNYDFGYAIAIDQSGAAYITGQTVSDDLITTSGAFDVGCGTDNVCDYDGTYVYYDAFVIKLDNNGSGPVYATYLGGNNSDGGYGIAVDRGGNAYITGYTYSSVGFPVSSNAYDRTPNGLDDGFVVKLNATGSGLGYATLMGGSDGDNGRSIVVDSNGSAYVAGLTFSSSFPTTNNGFDTIFNGGDDAFVVKVNPSGTTLSYSTFMGGNSTDEALGIALSATDTVYIAGLTSSGNFPTTPGAYDTSYIGNRTCGTDPNSHPCYDAFVAKLTLASRPRPLIKPVFLPLTTRPRVVVSLCDTLEPNNNRRMNPIKLESGRAYQAGLCINDEDNYFFDILRNARPTITLDLPPALRAKTLIWVYAQTDLGTTICGIGAKPPDARIIVSNCGGLTAGRYIVRLYTNNGATDFDNQNPYTLRVTL